MKIPLVKMALTQSTLAEAEPLLGFDYGGALYHVLAFDFGDDGGALGVWREGDNFCARITLDALAEFSARARESSDAPKVARTLAEQAALDGVPWTYNRPTHGWTCFHCGETFRTPGSAEDHFGKTPMAEPGCVLKVSLGPERGLLMALRLAEERIASYVSEDNALQREMYRMQSRHSEALRTAEEAGYERGLRDAIAREHAIAKEQKG